MLETIVLMMTMLGMIMIAGWAFCLDARMSGYSATKEIVAINNTAVGIRFGLFLFAFVLSFSQVIHPSAISFAEDLNIIAQYGLIIIVLLGISRYVNDLLILSAFKNNVEVVDEQNNAVSVVEGATYLASAMILSGALAEWQTGHSTALLWYAVGQIFLVSIYKIYQLVNREITVELDRHNLAAAFSAGGYLLAGGVMLGHAINGSTRGFMGDLWDVSLYVGMWLVFVMVAHFVIDLFLVPGAKISYEIYKDKNPAVGILTAAVTLGITLFYTLVQ